MTPDMETRYSPSLAARLPLPCGRRSLVGYTDPISCFCTCFKVNGKAVYKYPDFRLIMMARAPVSGKVKSRLARTIGNRRAAGVYRNMLRTQISKLLAAKICPLELHVCAPVQHPLFMAMRRGGVVRVEQQRGNNLGSRMHHAIRSGLQRADAVILIGADVPGISVEQIRQVCTLISGQDELIIMPAEDGGYGLLAMRKVDAGLFRGVHWGSQRVCKQTVKRATQLGISYRLFSSCYDIDFQRDLARLRKLGVRLW